MQLCTTTTTNTTTGSATTAFTVTNPPVAAGSVFVTDLGTGLSVSVVSVAQGAGHPGAIPGVVTVVVPVQGSGPVGVQLKRIPTCLTTRLIIRWFRSLTGGNTTGSNFGGRIIRILPDGIVNTFAEGFDTSGLQSAQSFIDSSFTLTFSADGTTLWAADNQGIWQFKSTASLAGSTTGTLIGLNDLRTLGVPYDGINSAVAVVDTGVDAISPPFRGRVSPGTNVWTGGLGNKDLLPLGGGVAHGRAVEPVVRAEPAGPPPAGSR